ncbi:HpcH/HpaI aldolase/citrate lyase family protein [Aliiroseovarius subalbicans]|uniref:HpcH/HpaI aldolase family protein n=1 Tax=Aliiroseovarius subalbicans TaxID=2925840 RepID=UPI001F595626|nr:HpcH/HpaI aldolase/citrate lyase family protein [Aliiroseovarius subalbicans]MCI2398213.1 HpcH/HpaI aldolase/citrate lyase family protein [Aliiroseovarius subalbicans]
MAAPENKLKRALAAGEMQLGLWLNLGDAGAAEMAGRAGYDWALIDGEHGPYNPTTILGQLRALGQFPISSVLRVPIGEDWVIKQALDLGVQSLLIPMVDTGAQAAQMVRATRYAPAGVRGMGAAVARASGFGTDNDYVATADAEICLLLQAETRQAIENIDDIAGTEGVDCVFIGPADLSADMGHPGNPAAPEVKEAIAHAVSRIRASGKAAGIIHYDPSDFASYRDLGVTFLGTGSDVSLLRAGMQANLAAARAAVAP